MREHFHKRVNLKPMESKWYDVVSLTFIVANISWTFARGLEIKLDKFIKIIQLAIPTFLRLLLSTILLLIVDLHPCFYFINKDNLYVNLVLVVTFTLLMAFALKIVPI